MKMEINTRANFATMNFTGRDHSLTKMVLNTRATGKTTKCTDMES